jgi:hypothetical protein
LNPIPHNLIDDINSASQIDSLLSALDDYFRHTKTDTALLFENEAYRRFADSLKAQPWIKADLDGNGYTDLVVASLRDFHEYRPVCILDSGNNRFHTKSLYLEKLGECSFPKLVMVNSTPLVVQYSLTDWTDIQPELRWQEIDTLIIKDGEFIEWNPSPRRHAIKMIKLSTTLSMGDPSSYDFSIFDDRTAIYTTKWLGKESGTFTIELDGRHYKELTHLLEYIDFTHLEDYYLTAETCGPTYRLKIVYDNNKVKLINDQALGGTFGLRIFYRLLSELREAENWK